METNADILVAGAGLAGLSTALALAQAGRNIVVAGPIDTRATTRTVALFDGSVRFLTALGLRPQLEAHGAPLHIMRIVDDSGSLFRGSPAEFDAGEIGLDRFGWNIENGALLGILAEAAKADPRIKMIDALVERYEFHPDKVAVTLNNGVMLETALVAACDGYQSLARESAGISVQEWAYPQIALTAILSHRLPHDDVSTEFHTREGPCAFVPLPNAPEGGYRSSLVWLMQPHEARRREALDAEALTREIEKAAHRLLGRMKLERGPAFTPMRGLLAREFSGPRIALLSETAHAFPPIGAQGLNLGLRDVAHLRDCVERGGEDPGAPAVMAEFARARRADISSRTFGVDLLNRSLLTHILPVDFARGVGLQLLRAIGPLRRFAMREGVMPGFNVPSMMRAPEDTRSVSETGDRARRRL